MSDNRLSTIATIVAILGGCVALYKVFFIDPSEREAERGYIQVLSARGESGYLPIDGGNVTTVHLKAQNLGKHDVIEVRSKMTPSVGNKDIFDHSEISSNEPPVAIEPGQEFEIEFMSRGTPSEVAKNIVNSYPTKRQRAIASVINEYRYQGTIGWKDRLTRKSYNENWCFKGESGGFQNSFINAYKKESNKRSRPLHDDGYTEDIFTLEICDLK